MVHEVALARSHVGIVERLVDGQRVCLKPFAILVVETLLRDLANVDLRIEVGGEGLVMVSSVAIYDVKVVDLVEVVLGGIGREDAADPRVETTTEDGCEARLLEALTVGPLPTVLEVGLVLGLIVGGVEVVAAAGQTGLHDGEVLIRQGEVDDQFGLVARHKGLQLLHVVGIDLGRLDGHLVAFVVDGLHESVAFLHMVACNHHLGEDVRVLRNLEGGDGSYATRADH